MLSPKTRKNISRIIPFSLIWLVFSIVYLLLERGILGKLDKYPSTGNPYNFLSNLTFTPIAAFTTGLIIGTIEIVYFNKLFIQKRFIQKLFL
jgi:adenylate cyclase